MSVQFGRWNIQGSPVDPRYWENVNALLRPFGPDGCSSYEVQGLAITCHAFHTTPESRVERAPAVLPSGSVLTWDGRLDNREELLSFLGTPASDSGTDLSIVSALYERCGAKCFGKLVGDWALSVWDPSERVLLLAKDFLGIRHLYYSVSNDAVARSTLLEPLVRLSGRDLEPNEEFIAGWLCHFPDASVSPYLGIQVVPPASYVRIGDRHESVHRYWNFDPDRRIRYQEDASYEEHFRSVFGQAVRRRLRSASPVLAELSGGMDSSSIVCMTDHIARQDRPALSCVDTISYFIDSDANWNERPYVSAVEHKRNRAGMHVDIGHDTMTDLWRSPEAEVFDPNAWRSSSSGATEFRKHLSNRGMRVLLSGIGGDEVLAGIPNPTPELAELLRNGSLGMFARQLLVWATAKKRPVYFLLADLVRAYLPPHSWPARDTRYLPTWLRQEFVARHRKTLHAPRTRLEWFGTRPSFQDNLHSLDALRNQLACFPLPFEPPYEKRYPYLDRDLLEFLFALPPEQLLRPNERRSLMRRALRQILPDEILTRSRKAFVTRHPLPQRPAQWTDLHEFAHNLHPATRQVIDATAFDGALTSAEHGREVPLIPLLRTAALDLWLRSVSDRTAEKENVPDQRPIGEMRSEAPATISQLRTTL